MEVIPMAYKPVKVRIDEKYGEWTVFKKTKHKAGTVVTENGIFILD